MTRRPKADDTGGGGDVGAVPEGGGAEVPALGSAADAYYYTLLAPMSVSAKLWSALSSLPSVVVAGEEDWQTLRIKQGTLCVVAARTRYLVYFLQKKGLPCVFIQCLVFFSHAENLIRT